MNLSDVHRLAAFCDGEVGGNPAGVVLCPDLPDPTTMQSLAAEVGYSETAFAAPVDDDDWRVRYFAPEVEIPFCGHATIAIGALLALKHGAGTRKLLLNDAEISVEGTAGPTGMHATLVSPPTSSRPADAGLVADALRVFSYKADQLDPRLPPASAHAGNDHLVLTLRSRDLLGRMAYDLDAGRSFMLRAGIATVTFAYFETPHRILVRNPFASGGVYEDPATGSAAAALGGYLRDIGWPAGGPIEILQGQDLGIPCRLVVDVSACAEGRVRVSGRARFLE